MPDETERIVLKVESDQQTASATAQTLSKHRQDVSNTSAEYIKLARNASRLREVGVQFAALGGMIVAPFVLAAREYATRFAGLEATANRYNAAIQRQTDATSTLGRVAATALTPQMERIANITEKIAAFASAHPELVNAGLNLGAVLVAGGGAIAAVGHVQQTLERINAIAASGGLAGNLITAVVSIGALAAGAKIGEVAVNAFGKATGNSALEHFQLADALKTARQIIGGALLLLGEGFVEAKNALGQMIDKLTDAFATVKSRFESAIDQFSTGFQVVILKMQQGLGTAINGILSMLHLSGGDTNAWAGKGFNGKSVYEQQIDQVLNGYDQRQGGRDTDLSNADQQLGNNQSERNQQYAQDKANLAHFADQINNFAATGTLGAGVDKAIQTVKDKINQFTNTKGPGITTNGSNVSPEFVKDFAERMKKQSASDIRFNDETKALKTKFDDEEKKAQQKHQDEIARINEDYMTTTAKAYRDFYISEAKETARANLDRMRLLQDTSDQLNDLAANRDVAGFVRAKRDADKQLSRQAEDLSIAEQQRQADFLLQRKDAADAHDKQLRDLDTSFKNEERDRKNAYQEQLTQLQTKHAAEKREIDRAFAEQVSTLAGNYAGLQTMHNNYYASMNAAALNFVTTQRGYLQSLYAGVNPGSAVYAQSAGAVSRSDANSMQTYMNSYTAPQPNVTINATVGDVVTSRDLHSLARSVTDGVAAARSY